MLLWLLDCGGYFGKYLGGWYVVYVYDQEYTIQVSAGIVFIFIMFFTHVSSSFYLLYRYKKPWETLASIYTHNLIIIIIKFNTMTSLDAKALNLILFLSYKFMLIIRNKWLYFKAFGLSRAYPVAPSYQYTKLYILASYPMKKQDSHHPKVETKRITSILYMKSQVSLLICTPTEHITFVLNVKISFVVYSSLLLCIPYGSIIYLFLLLFCL